MITRSAFHIDCTTIIPECEFKCAKCVQEIQSVLGEIQGVDKSYIEGEGKETKLMVEHDPSMAGVEKLIDIFEGLPSFYEGRFIPTMITS